MPLPKTPPKMFETRSQAWQEVGLLEQVRPAAARRARVEALLMVALFVGVIVLWEHRVSILGEATLDEIETPLKVVVVVALLVLGWAIARDFGRALGPALFRRMEPATAGTVGFLIRLLTVGWRCWWRWMWPASTPRRCSLGGRVHGRDPRLGRAADAGQRVRGDGAAQRGPLPRGRSACSCRAGRSAARWMGW